MQANNCTVPERNKRTLIVYVKHCGGVLSVDFDIVVPVMLSSMNTHLVNNNFLSLYLQAHWTGDCVNVCMRLQKLKGISQNTTSGAKATERVVTNDAIIANAWRLEMNTIRNDCCCCC
uniref:Uncharacterized protein n=1 Tax=Glossina austeni TaxID=7395 RepID=A0A1A9VIK7_GLOAU